MPLHTPSRRSKHLPNLMAYATAILALSFALPSLAGRGKRRTFRPKGNFCQSQLYHPKTHKKSVVYSSTGRARWVYRAEKDSLEDLYPGVSQIVWFHFKLIKFPSQSQLQKLRPSDVFTIFEHTKIVLGDLEEKLQDMILDPTIKRDLVRESFGRMLQTVANMRARLKSQGNHKNRTNY